jgi:Magnesium chelatase, subunit ChlI
MSHVRLCQVADLLSAYGAVGPVVKLDAPEARPSRRARLLTTILPAMTLAAAFEATRIHRVDGLMGGRTALVTTRPCRVPHHTISDVGLIGGGAVPMPGEVSLAHHGILFLDELPEFRRHVLEVLRQSLEGHLAQDLGWGCWSPFGYPQAHEDAAQRARRAGGGWGSKHGQDLLYFSGEFRRLT